MPTEKDKNWVIRIGLASCGLAAGGRKVYDAFAAKLRDKGLNVALKSTGCMGMCYNEVLVEVVSPDNERVFYRRVTPNYVQDII